MTRVYLDNSTLYIADTGLDCVWFINLPKAVVQAAHKAIIVYFGWSPSSLSPYNQLVYEKKWSEIFITAIPFIGNFYSFYRLFWLCIAIDEEADERINTIITNNPTLHRPGAIPAPRRQLTEREVFEAKMFELHQRALRLWRERNGEAGIIPGKVNW